MVAVASPVAEGHVARGFEAVRDAFEENFARRGELGGACCAYYRGALGFADPDAEIGYGSVTSKMGMNFAGDARDVALREALHSVLTIR